MKIIIQKRTIARLNDMHGHSYGRTVPTDGNLTGNPQPKPKTTK